MNKSFLITEGEPFLIPYFIVAVAIIGLVIALLGRRGIRLLKTQRCTHCGYIWSPSSSPNEASSTKHCPWCEHES